MVGPSSKMTLYTRVCLSSTLLLVLSATFCTANPIFKPNKKPLGPFTSSPSSFSFAVLSDIHIGESAPIYNGSILYSNVYLDEAIQSINARAAQDNIKFVFITGDMTDSAEPLEFMTARKQLLNLTIPWFPMLGNHDCQPYNSEMEAMQPVGDALFASIFSDRFTPEYTANIPGVSIIYNNETVYNPAEDTPSWFQNYQLTINETLVIFCLDWNTRLPAILNDINKGTLPMAELHNYSGGTYQWLDARLADLAAWQSAHPNQTLQIVFMHHQGYRVPIYIPNPAFFTFSAEERHKVQALLLKHFPADTYWGVIAGHIHRWYNDTAFDEPGWENFWQWETDACKGQWDNKNIHSGWSLVRVGTDNRISSLERVIQPMSLSSVENQVVQERNESFHKVIG